MQVYRHLFDPKIVIGELLMNLYYFIGLNDIIRIIMNIAVEISKGVFAFFK
jgi:hypothetical protein